jgi:hypothetical protein
MSLFTLLVLSYTLHARLFTQCLLVSRTHVIRRLYSRIAVAAAHSITASCFLHKLQQQIMPSSQHLMEAVQAIEVLIDFKQGFFVGLGCINLIWSTHFEMLAFTHLA